METKEPWIIVKNVIIMSTQNDEGSSYDLARFRYRKDAERAVDCVNALKGIYSPETFVKSTKETIEVLKTYRQLLDKKNKSIQDLNKKLLEAKQALCKCGFSNDSKMITEIDLLTNKNENEER
jgi:hypothetical protein